MRQLELLEIENEKAEVELQESITKAKLLLIALNDATVKIINETNCI
jgi:hypothetical protein